MRDLLPRGKMITPKEIADVVAFLASDRASAMCGQIVTVDAGFAARSYGRRVVANSGSRECRAIR